MSKSKASDQRAEPAVVTVAPLNPHQQAKRKGTPPQSKTVAGPVGSRGRTVTSQRKPAVSKTGDRPSKRNRVLQLLHGKRGTTIEEMQSATGWQPHSVRGFLSGTVKKRLGLKLKSSKSKDGERRYSVAG
jgi:hypothetical protein